MATLNVQTGTLSKTSLLVNEGSLIAQINGGQLEFCHPQYPYPRTPFRLAKGYNEDMYFDPLDTIPEVKLNKVELDETVDIRAFLESEDPATGTTYSESLGIDLDNAKTDAELLAEFPEGTILEAMAAFTEKSDPYITQVMDAIEVYGNPIVQRTLPVSQKGVLAPFAGQTIQKVIVDRLSGRSSTLQDYYLLTAYNIEATLLASIQVKL